MDIKKGLNRWLCETQCKSLKQYVRQLLCQSNILVFDTLLLPPPMRPKSHGLRAGVEHERPGRREVRAHGRRGRGVHDDLNRSALAEAGTLKSTPTPCNALQ